MKAPVRRFVGASLVWLCAFALQGCTTAALRMDRTASSSGLEVLRLSGGDHALRAYAQNVPGRRVGVLHVYLEGDGKPWIAGGTRVARDPHGEHNLAFELMRLDPAPSLYLKRPCYQDVGGSSEVPCHPLLWTHQRYSEAVVQSMADALRGFLREHPASELHFYGYSGGGVLGMLLAPEFPETTRVVTIAGNLDVGAWAQRHGYTPLAGSLDPSRLPPLPECVEQLHLVGELDDNVPPDLVRAAVETQPGAVVRVVEGFDHVCCWQDLWPEILD